MQLLANGDEGAFAEIYHRYWKLLFSIAANKIGDLADAEEAVQDVFVGLWKRREEVYVRQSIKSYLAGAIKYQVYDRLDKKYRMRRKQQSLQQEQLVVPSVEEQYNLIALQEQLQDAAAQLPERCRLVYELSREAGLSNREIAEALDIAEKTVENQMTRALKHLRTSLKALFSFLGLF